MKGFFFSVLIYSLLPYNAISVFGQRQDFGNASELVFSSIIYRHGERNPENMCPNDQYKDPSHWMEGLGSLTDAGKVQ
nr:hypothetical protein [Shewanella shenzhenensis]